MRPEPSPIWSPLTRDDATIEYCRWGDADPDAAPPGVVVIAHGANEHADRYSRFAALLVDDGLVVYGLDHRGHGRTADRHGEPGIARPGGWAAMIGDIAALIDHVQDRHHAPVVLLGHSMGSLLVQGVMQRDGVTLDGVVLSGTSGSLDGAEDLVGLLRGIEDAEGHDQPSALFAGMIAGFNEVFAASVPEPTGSEWLSRDADEVALYVADPWCGGTLSNGFVTDMIAGMAEMWQAGAEDRIPPGLPILLIAGDRDPVGDNGASVRALADRYEAMGRGPITLRLYPDARHEVLNETNRAEVHLELRTWIASVLTPDMSPG